MINNKKINQISEVLRKNRKDKIRDISYKRRRYIYTKHAHYCKIARYVTNKNIPITFFVCNFRIL